MSAWWWWWQQSPTDRQPLVIATSQYTGNISSDILSPNVSDYFSVIKIDINPYLFRLYSAGGVSWYQSVVTGNGSSFDF